MMHAFVATIHLPFLPTSLIVIVPPHRQSATHRTGHIAPERGV